ncbi:MAG: UbiD-like subunit of potential (de) carboxylase, partial [Chloroflexi bacterium]|nr:UbiD-like subunit of potential (de) carboxylase [Chloroflexota bacterium]
PYLSPEKRAAKDYTHSRAVIDATRPFHWRDQFPKVVGTSRDLQDKMRAKWGADFFK